MTRAWDKEKSESSTRIEPMTSRTPGGRSIHATELRKLMESKVKVFLFRVHLID